MKKKIIISIVAALFIIGLGGFSYYKYDSIQQEKLEKQYSKRLAENSFKINLEFLLSTFICANYSQVWSNAIDNQRDFNVELASYQDKITGNGMLDLREKGQEEIRNNMKLLQNPPEKYKDSYNSLKKLYGTYTKMVDQALSPSGSLLEFNRYTGQLASQFEEEKEQLEITLPADTKKIREKLEDKKKKDAKNEDSL